MRTHCTRTASAAATFTLAVLSLGSATGCASLSPPFDGMKAAPTTQMTVYRLQNFVPPAAPAQAATPAPFQLPPQLQQWVQAGASLLPPGLLPPGLIPGAQAAAPAPTAPRFHDFPILDYQQVADASLRGDVLDALGHQANYQNPTTSCFYAELGVAITQPNNPTPADMLVSLSCQQVRAFNFAWPYQQTGLTPDTEKKFSAIMQRAFQGR
jgi:hypothetical protein